MLNYKPQQTFRLVEIFYLYGNKAASLVCKYFFHILNHFRY